jgi:hypothetical protein
MELPKSFFDDLYKQKDPWGYETNHHDFFRRDKIKEIFGERYYTRALDIGCGHGFITTALPAWERYGLDWAEGSTNHVPSNVTAIKEPYGQYDLVVATGVMYNNFRHRQIHEMIMQRSTYHILIAGIKDWLMPHDYKSEIIAEVEFPYREYVQKVTLYQRIK